VHVTERLLREADTRRAGSPIGEALPDLSLYVLDRYGEPVPVGVAGEIYVGGRGVSRGYLGQAGLTALRFVPDPYGEPGERMYRSGDLGRRLPEGEIEYLGRADQQLKLRGFRIEPGEIEAALLGQPGVREALVVLDTPEQGEKRLVAYITGTAEPLALRQALSQTLPAHMLPALIMPLERFPLTHHGKIDHKALPKPGLIHAAPGEAPRPGLEQQVAAILCGVLRITHIDRTQNFFDLGGDSILATQAVFRLRELFGVNLSLRRLMEAATIEGLAGEISVLLSSRENAHAVSSTPLQRSKRRLAQKVPA
jgi:acyl carrier protein